MIDLTLRMLYGFSPQLVLIITLDALQVCQISAGMGGRVCKLEPFFFKVCEKTKEKDKDTRISERFMQFLQFGM